MPLKEYWTEHPRWLIALGLSIIMLGGVIFLFGNNSTLFTGRIDLTPREISPDATNPDIDTVRTIPTPKPSESTDSEESETGPIREILVDASITPSTEKPVILPEKDVISPAFSLGQITKDVDLSDITDSNTDVDSQTTKDAEDALVSVTVDVADARGFVDNSPLFGDQLDDLPRGTPIPNDFIPLNAVDTAEPDESGTPDNPENPDDPEEGQDTPPDDADGPEAGAGAGGGAPAGQAPYAEDLVIVGTPEVGKNILATYTFIDDDDDLEGASILEWYVFSPQPDFADSIISLWASLLSGTEPDATVSLDLISEFITDDPERIGTNELLALDSLLARKFVFFRYQPKSTVAPTNGRFYYSNLVQVQVAQEPPESDLEPDDEDGDGDGTPEPDESDNEDDEGAAESETGAEQAPDEPLAPAADEPTAPTGTEPTFTGTDEPTAPTDTEPTFANTATNSAIVIAPTTGTGVSGSAIVIEGNTGTASFNLNSNTNASLLGAAHIQGNTGPGFVLYPILAFFSWLLSRLGLQRKRLTFAKKRF